MSLQLSKSKPRQLQYAVGGLRDDLKLIEVDDKLLHAIQHDQVVIKGNADNDAVLCTSNKTYALKVVETTNSLLLLPPQQEVDETFAAIPSLAPLDGDSGGLRDVGLQTQLRKNSAALDYPALTATATAKAHIELVEITPRLDTLPQLLGKPYSLEDEEQTEAAEAMDAEGPGVSSSSSSSNYYTTEQLLQRVQGSHAELLAELSRLNAVQLNGRWRLVDDAYLGALLEMLIVISLEKGWSNVAIPLQEAVAALQPDGYLPALTKHCLQVYGSPCPTDGSTAAATQPSCSISQHSTCSSHYALDESKVCLHYARKLMREKEVWYRQAFLAAWFQEVPNCWQPREDMLLGEALFIQPEANEGAVEPKLRHFPASALPSAPGPRFAALFSVQPRWTREQLDPYLEGLKVPGQTVEMLLLAYARASQRSPTDPTVVFVARY